MGIGRVCFSIARLTHCAFQSAGSRNAISHLDGADHSDGFPARSHARTLVEHAPAGDRACAEAYYERLLGDEA